MCTTSNAFIRTVMKNKRLLAFYLLKFVEEIFYCELKYLSKSIEYTLYVYNKNKNIIIKLNGEKK